MDPKFIKTIKPCGLFESAGMVEDHNGFNNNTFYKFLTLSLSGY